MNQQHKILLLKADDRDLILQCPFRNPRQSSAGDAAEECDLV